MLKTKIINTKKITTNQNNQNHTTKTIKIKIYIIQNKSKNRLTNNDGKIRIHNLLITIKLKMMMKAKMVFEKLEMSMKKII